MAKHSPYFATLVLTGTLSSPGFGEFYLGGGASYNFLDYELPDPGLLVSPVVPASPSITPSSPVPGPSFISPEPIFVIPDVEVNINEDDEDSGWKVFIGYRFNPIFSLELAYVDLGKAQAEINTHNSVMLGSVAINSTFTQDLEVDTSGFALLGVFNYPTDWSVSPYAKMGVLNWEEKSTSHASFTSNFISATPIVQPPFRTSHSEHGNSAILGLGVEYKLSDKTSIRVEYEYIDDVQERDIESLSASFIYYPGSDK